MFTSSTRTTAHTPTSSADRRLDALAVEAALNGRRPYRALPAPEVAEVLRIRRRNGDTLDQVAELLDVDASVLAEQYAAAGPR